MYVSTSRGDGVALYNLETKQRLISDDKGFSCVTVDNSLVSLHIAEEETQAKNLKAGDTVVWRTLLKRPPEKVISARIYFSGQLIEIRVLTLRGFTETHCMHPEAESTKIVRQYAFK